MEDNKALYLLAELDARAQRRLSGYYEALTRAGLIGAQSQGIAYHITLGDLCTDLAAETVERLEAVCARTAPIDLRMDHLGLFERRVLFVQPNINFELLELHRQFFPGGGHGAHCWAPHVTMLLDEDPDAIQRATAILSARFEPFCAAIEQVALYEFFPSRRIARHRLAG